MHESFKFPNQFIDSQFLPYLSRKDIGLLLNSLANSINEKYQGQELVALGVLKGGLSFAADLVRKLRGMHLVIDFIKLSRLGKANDSSPRAIRIEQDVQADICDKNVLIIEDIVDSGKALCFIQRRLELANPRSIATVALFNRTSQRKQDVRIDYVGKNVKERFIIGYGMDLEGYGRNLEDVYYLKYPN